MTVFVRIQEIFLGQLIRWECNGEVEIMKRNLSSVDPPKYTELNNRFVILG